MTLVDTSVWVEFFRRKGDPGVKQRVVDLMSGDLAAYTCPVLFELLAGVRQKAESDLIHGAFALCERLVFEPQLWERAALVEQSLRQKGTPVPPDDVFVAVVAMAQDVPLMCRDAHFDSIQRNALPKLRVVQV